MEETRNYPRKIHWEIETASDGNYKVACMWGWFLRTPNFTTSTNFEDVTCENCLTRRDHVGGIRYPKNPAYEPINIKPRPNELECERKRRMRKEAKEAKRKATYKHKGEWARNDPTNRGENPNPYMQMMKSMKGKSMEEINEARRKYAREHGCKVPKDIMLHPERSAENRLPLQDDGVPGADSIPQGNKNEV